MASSSGYDAYKSALKNTKTIQNVSIQTQAQLQDNGNTLTSANGSFKFSLENRTGSGTVTVSGSGAEHSVSFFKQTDGVVLKPSDSDVYYVKEHRQSKHGDWNKQDNPERQQQVETVIDALVGNLKDYVTVEDKADGSKEVSVELTNAQLPALVNAIAPIAIKHATGEHEHDGESMSDQQDGGKPLPFRDHSLLAGAPQLTQDIKIEKVAVKAEINASNYIEHQQADITVSGKDASGVAHELTLHLNAELSGYNSTTPDTVDLTGKQVQQVKHGHRGKAAE